MKDTGNLNVAPRARALQDRVAPTPTGATSPADLVSRAPVRAAPVAEPAAQPETPHTDPDPGRFVRGATRRGKGRRRRRV
jgi:hypothetical protein